MYRVDNLPDLNDVGFVSLATECRLRIMKWWGREVTSELTSIADARSRVREYAAATKTSEAFVWKRIKRKRRLPRSIAAIALHDDNERLWGVVVVDSSNAHTCIDVDERRFKVAFTDLRRKLFAYGLTQE
jgi:hypothetical protein